MGSTSSKMSVSPAIQYRDPQRTSYSSNNTASSSRLPPNPLPLNDITSLRAAALKSARGKREGSESGSSTPASLSGIPPLLAPEVIRNGSVSTTLGVPLSKVEIADEDEREEGEISEDDEEEKRLPPQSRYTLNSRPSSWHSVALQRRPQSSSEAPVPRYPSPPRNPLPSPPRGLPRLDKGKAPESAATGQVHPAPSDISPNEARQYMDIIRNLLQEGFTPDTLVKRGATAKYVTAVCEEIVQGTKRRKELWLESRPADPSSRSDRSIARSPSAEVEIMVSTNRRASMSSEGSAEYELLENPSPPRPRHPRLIPSSHWAPPLKSTPIPPAHAIKIESYKPTQSASGSIRVSSIPSTSSRAASDAVPIATSISPPIPIPQNVPDSVKPPSTNHLPAPLSTLPAKPLPTGPKSSVPVRREKRRKFIDAVETDQVMLNYDEEPPTTATITPSVLLASGSPSLLAPVTPAMPTSTSSPGLSGSTDADLAAKSLLLETRRKALESMKMRRRPKPSYEDMDIDSPLSSSGIATPDFVAPSVTRNIEQEVMDLEREVMGLQADAVAETAEEDMELDTPESGEIRLPVMPSSLPLPRLADPPAAPTLVSSSLSSTSRGTKRPNAEDLDSRPVSIPPSWSQGKRKPFGFTGQVSRPSLIINLDEQDSDSEDEGRSMPPVVENPIDEKIRLLKEQIAAKMKDREAKKLKTESQSDLNTLAAPSPTPANAQLAADASLAADVDEVAQLEHERDDALKANSVKILPRGARRQMKVEAEAAQLKEEKQRMGMSADGNEDRSGRDMAMSQDDVAETSDQSHLDLAPALADASRLIEESSPINQLQPQVSFSGYQPLLRRYPQLTAATHTIQSFPQFAISTPQDSSRSWTTIDRPLLNSIILTNRTTQNRQAVMCKAEAGGGFCADQDCQDIHLDKGDPTVEDLTEYVTQSLSARRDIVVEGNAIEKAVRLIIAPRQVPQAGNKSIDKGKRKAFKSSFSLENQTGPENSLASDEVLSVLLAKIAGALKVSK